MKDQICTIMLYDVQTKLTVGSRECCVPNNPLFFDNHFFPKWSPPLLVLFFSSVVATYIDECLSFIYFCLIFLFD